MSLTAVGRIEAILAADEHADAVAAFFRAVWNGDGGAPSRNAQASDAPAAIVWDGTRVLGYCGTIPYRLWDGLAEHPAHWVKGLMVLPEYRRGPIGFLVAKQLAMHLTCATALVVAPPARRLFVALGYKDLGAVTNFVRLLRPARLARGLDVGDLGLGLPRWLAAAIRAAQRAGLATVASGAAGVVLDLAASTLGRPTTGLVTACTMGAPSREELDLLWRSAREAIAASPVRDGLYLRSRYGADGTPADDCRYSFITARDDGRLVGIAVLLQPKATGDPRLRGVRVATISDVVFAPSHAGVGLAVLAAAERAARAAGADAILCTTDHRALRRVLWRRAYVPLPGNVHFFVRDTTGSVRLPRDLDSWWLARGDSGADEVF